MEGRGMEEWIQQFVEFRGIVESTQRDATLWQSPEFVAQTRERCDNLATLLTQQRPLMNILLRALEEVSDEQHSPEERHVQGEHGAVSIAEGLAELYKDDSPTGALADQEGRADSVNGSQEGSQQEEVSSTTNSSGTLSGHTSTGERPSSSEHESGQAASDNCGTCSSGSQEDTERKGHKNHMNAPGASRGHRGGRRSLKLAEQFGPPPPPLRPGVTSLKVQKIPPCYTQESLLDVWPLDGSYDFLQLVCDNQPGGSDGTAIINFVSEEHALGFQERWHGQSLSPDKSGTLLVGPAEKQGRLAHLQQVQEGAGVLPIVTFGEQRLEAQRLLRFVELAQSDVNFLRI